jgi:hypothetical protein
VKRLVHKNIVLNNNLDVYSFFNYSPAQSPDPELTPPPEDYDEQLPSPQPPGHYGDQDEQLPSPQPPGHYGDRDEQQQLPSPQPPQQNVR